MLQEKMFALAGGTAMAITLRLCLPIFISQALLGEVSDSDQNLWRWTGSLSYPYLVRHKRNCLLTLLVVAHNTIHANKEEVLGNMRID